MSLIIPPPEIKAIVDKTAAFVAKNGPQFEGRIQENEKGNLKFVFMNQGDPYRAYYEFKLNWFNEHPNETPKDTVKKDKPQRKKKQIEIPQEPPALDFNLDPPSIQAKDLEIIKLVALFVAKNGKQFMEQILENESQNYQFDFLRPTHSVFTFFTQLVEQYSKILDPSQVVLTELRVDAEDRFGVLRRVMKRVEFKVYNDAMSKRVEEETEAERIAFGEIDWHDFVLVDTIEFVKGDKDLVFPGPLFKADLEKIVFSMEKKQVDDILNGNVNNDDGEEEEEDMDMDMSEDEDLLKLKRVKMNE